MKPIYLPEIPPRRLIKEALRSYHLELLKDPAAEPEPIDPETAPWETVRRIVLAHVRHRLSDYDERLNKGEDHDLLRATLDGAAYRRYPWLKGEDPRPFPPEEPRKIFDEIAADLVELRDYEHELVEALHSPGGKACRDRLKEKLVAVRAKIAAKTDLLITSEVTENGIMFAVMGNPTPGDYYWLGAKLLWNHLIYRGFRCPGCGKAVFGTKRPMPLGQGKRFDINSCHCLIEFGIASPDGRKVEPVTLERWEAKLVRVSGDLISPDTPPHHSYPAQLRTSPDRPRRVSRSNCPQTRF
jgi:hypothetical protein